VKIKDVIQESVYDFFTKGTAAQTQAAAMAQDRQNTYRAGIVQSTSYRLNLTNPILLEIAATSNNSASRYSIQDYRKS
jgi:hypothetical protein